MENVTDAALLERSIAGLPCPKRPVKLFINFPFIKSLTNVDLGEYFSDPRIMMDAQIETYARLGMDGPLSPDYGVAAECHGLGAQLLFDAAGFPSVRADGGHPIEYYANMQPADPLAGSWMTRSIETLAYMKAHAPSGFRVENSLVVAPFTVAAMYRGISDFCMDLVDETECVTHFLETVTETCVRYAREQEKVLGSLEHILLGDDIASFVSKPQFDAYVKPTYERFFAPFPNVQRWLHNDAEALHLAEGIADAGFVLWHTGNCFDIFEARRRTGGRVSLVGNLAPVEQVAKRSAEQVKRAAAELADKFGSDPKYVLGIGGFISYGTPLENVRAIIRAAEEQE